MANLETTNVFIDTESFLASNLNFESTAFKETVRLAKAKRARVFLTTVTKSEVQAHIQQRIHAALPVLEKFRDKGRMFRNVQAFGPVFAQQDEAEMVDEICAKFEKFLTEAGATVLDLTKADAETIFKDYFDKKAPFGEDKKKHEFPDAFAQQALINWCEANNGKMYVVSADPDWQALKGNKYLIPITTLPEFINSAVKDESDALTKKVLQLYRANLVKVEAAITEAFKESGFYTDDVDGDVNEVTVNQLTLNEPQILEVDGDSATLSVFVNLKYEADVTYEDDDEGIWDSEDHVWFYRPTKHVEVEESEHFEAELYMEFDSKNDYVFNVVCNIGKDFRVTVLPTDYELK